MPAVLRGVLDRWPNVLFDRKVLARRFGDESILTYRLARGTHTPRMASQKQDFYVWSDGSGPKSHLRNWTFGEFLDALARGEPHYCMANRTKNVKLRSLLATAVGPFPWPAASSARPKTARCEFFIGSALTGPGLHHDGEIESFLCQLIGTKRINMFAPTDVANLYPAGRWTEPMGHFSKVVDSFNPDLSRYPLFANATPFRCTLKPGDVLYLPPHWYHDPCAAEPSAMMTIRHRPPKVALSSSATLNALRETASRLYAQLQRLPPEARDIYALRLAFDLVSTTRKKR